MITTKTVTSPAIKEKKNKVSSVQKQVRSDAPVGTAKRNRKAELKKDELIPLLARFEGELQGKEIAIAALKSERIRILLSIHRFGLFTSKRDPYAALLRDSERVKDDVHHEYQLVQNTHALQIARLHELITRQREEIQTLKRIVDEGEKRCSTLHRDLQNEKENRMRLQILQKNLLSSDEEKIQLTSELQKTQWHNKELEQQLAETMNLLEKQHERHKQFVVLFLNQRKHENEQYQDQWKKLKDQQQQNEKNYQDEIQKLKQENERTKNVLTTRIRQLQDEIDAFVQEKNKQSIDSRKESTTNRPKSADLPSTHKNGQVSPRGTSEKTSESTKKVVEETHPRTAPPNVSTSKIINETSSNKSEHIVPSVPTRLRQTSSNAELPTSPTPPVTRRHVTPIRSLPNQSQLPAALNPRTSTGNNPLSTNTIPVVSANPDNDLASTETNKSATKAKHGSVQSNPTIGPRKRLEQTSPSPENKIHEQRNTVEPTRTDNRSQVSDSNSIPSDLLLFQAAETGDAAQLVKLLKLGLNANRQNSDGNTSLHLASINGHLECIRHLLKYGANPHVENHLGKTAWNNLTRLSESLQLECLREFVEQSHVTPPTESIFGTIEREQVEVFNYLFTLLREQIKNDSTILSRLVRTIVRSSNTHFLTSILNFIPVQDMNRLLDPNTFISTECSTILTNLEKQTGKGTPPKPVTLLLRISSRSGEHPFSYAIGQISLTSETSWLELERSCLKIFSDYVAQLDSPLDYVKSSIGCTPNSIDTLSLGPTEWHYQDSPGNDAPKPYSIAQEQHSIIIRLKGLQISAVDSIAYNYFTPSHHLKNFMRYMEQNPYVGVYGAPYIQKRSLFDELIRYLERPMAFSSIPKFRSIKFEIEIVTSLDDLIDELIEYDFLRTSPWSSNGNEGNHSTKFLLYFANIQNSIGQEILQFLLNGESVNESCSKLTYTRADTPNAVETYYFPSKFHIFITLSKRAWPTENPIYKDFKWIPFKIENDPWSGLLKRHLWRRMIDTNICKNRTFDNELVATLKWVTNVWQRYNECLQKLSLQDALLGPALFFDCPMEREAIFEWLQNKWNTIVAPLVRELSVNKCASSKSKTNNSVTVTSSNSLENSGSYESVACTALYVLLHRAISRDCPLTGQEREQYLLNFVGSRLEPGSNGNSVLSSMNSSAASSRTNTPQPSSFGDFASIQLES